MIARSSKMTILEKPSSTANIQGEKVIIS